MAAVGLFVVLLLSVFASVPVTGEVQSGGTATVGNTSAPTITHPSLTDTEIRSATFTISVSKERIDALNATPENVTLYRYNEGWNAVNTSLTAETDSNYVFEATAPGLSVFAVGVENDATQSMTETTTTQTTTTSQTTTTTSESTTTTKATATTSGSSPGFGLTTALVALLGAALLVCRRR